MRAAGAGPAAPAGRRAAGPAGHLDRLPTALQPAADRAGATVQAPRARRLGHPATPAPRRPGGGGPLGARGGGTVARRGGGAGGAPAGRERAVRGLAAGLAARLALGALWVLLVCYPHPGVLGEAVRHTWHPPIDAAAVREWARTLPDDPRQLEAAVLARVRYAVPWETDGVPWAVPDPGRALARGAGDCQARALVLASVLAAKGLPFRLRASLDHVWVEYPGKPATALEDAAAVLWTRPVGAAPGLGPPTSPAAGPVAFRRPRVDWAASLRLERAYFWDAAPRARQGLLVLGLLLLAGRWPPGRRPRGPGAGAGRGTESAGSGPSPAAGRLVRRGRRCHPMATLAPPTPDTIAPPKPEPAPSIAPPAAPAPPRAPDLRPAPAPDLRPAERPRDPPPPPRGPVAPPGPEGPGTRGGPP
jgi:hypothetical protein